MEKTGKKEMTFQRENAFISIEIKCTNKWKNGQKRNDFLARKCIYQYLNKIYEQMEKWTKKK